MKLINDDCLVAMDKLIEEGIVVDAIICDPPYGTTVCKWDSVIPFDAMWERLNKLIKPNGAVVLFGSQPFTSVMVSSNTRGYKHHWVWDKGRGTGFQVAKYRPMMSTEDIIAFTSKGERIKYNPQKITLEKPKFYKNASSSNGVNPLSSFNKGGKLVNDKYPLNLIRFSKVSKTVHPTQKPVELMEYLIKTYTNENELILDFTMGSGTTGVACKNLNRDFIGIELDEEYFEIAKNRINNI